MTVDAHFKNADPAVRAIYDAILSTSNLFGPVAEDPKKTSIHLNRKTAFAGIAAQKRSLILTLKSATDIADVRINRRLQASKNRWYLYIKLSSPDELDGQLTTLLRDSYELSG
ncbi:MAG: DUF5655 domain-containing protein [Acidobacteriota bacterium]